MPHAAYLLRPLRLASARFWYSRYLVCSCDCDFYFYVSFRLVSFALLCSALLYSAFAPLSLYFLLGFPLMLLGSLFAPRIFGKMSPSVCPSVPLSHCLSPCVSPCMCVCDIRASFCIFRMLLILETWQRMRTEACGEATVAAESPFFLSPWEGQSKFLLIISLFCKHLWQGNFVCSSSGLASNLPAVCANVQTLTNICQSFSALLPDTPLPNLIALCT